MINFILVIIGLAVLVIGAIVAFNKESVIGAITSVILGAVIALFGMSFVIIPSGYTGVKTTFGQIAEETLPNGFNWKTPFIESIEIVNNKQHRMLVLHRKILRFGARPLKRFLFIWQM